ncbi:unnamed protein product [Timema podura]|uniref:Uncharacterized protein n=1 Tax=Timema podura TaxID=61482 RepID=A0ABN7PR06_TIMPD|nr:unnamed protein product [Timema podura]
MAEEASTMLGSPGLVCHPRRIQLTDQQLEAVTKEDLVKHWKEMESYVDFLESNTSVQEGRFNLEVVYPHLLGGKVENHLGKTTLGTLEFDRTSIFQSSAV